MKSLSAIRTKQMVQGLLSVTREIDPVSVQGDKGPRFAALTNVIAAKDARMCSMLWTSDGTHSQLRET
jgi:hypothetical protein